MQNFLQNQEKQAEMIRKLKESEVLMANKTQEFPVNMEEFLTTQPEEVKFLYENGQKMRDILTRATMQIMMDQGESLENKAVNDTFKRLARRAYTFTLRGPFLKDAQSRKYPSV